MSGDGERSRVFPVNLRSLFSYEGENEFFFQNQGVITNGIVGELLGELLRDCGLREGTGREENLSRFMAHIGACFTEIYVGEAD